MPDTTKFTDLPDGNEVQTSDQVIGIRSGADFRFDFPGDGIKDEHGKYYLKYVSSGAASVNYVQFTNTATGIGPIYGVAGTDKNIISCPFCRCHPANISVGTSHTINRANACGCICELHIINRCCTRRHIL